MKLRREDVYVKRKAGKRKDGLGKYKMRKTKRWQNTISMVIEL